MKQLNFAILAAAVVWCLACLLPSHDMAEFAARMGSDTGFVLRLAAAALTIFGVPYTVLRRLRRR